MIRFLLLLPVLTSSVTVKAGTFAAWMAQIADLGRSEQADEKWTKASLAQTEMLPVDAASAGPAVDDAVLELGKF